MTKDKLDIAGTAGKPLTPDRIAEIRARFERNYTNLVLGAELSIRGQTEVVSDVGYLQNHIDAQSSRIAELEKALIDCDSTLQLCSERIASDRVTIDQIADAFVNHAGKNAAKTAEAKRQQNEIDRDVFAAIDKTRRAAQVLSTSLQIEAEEIVREGYASVIFKNEFGSKIKVEIARAYGRGVEGILMEVTGPESKSSNWLTSIEFEHLMHAAAFISTQRGVEATEPQFDVESCEQERLAIEFCHEIAGPKGKPCSHPDTVRLLEMARDLYRADACHEKARATCKDSLHAQEPTVAEVFETLDWLFPSEIQRIVQRLARANLRIVKKEP